MIIDIWYAMRTVKLNDISNLVNNMLKVVKLSSVGNIYNINK